MVTLFFLCGVEAKKYARLKEKGRLTRIRKGIYIDSFDDDKIIRTWDTYVFDSGPGNVTSGTQQFTIELKKSNQARLCLENLATSCGNKKIEFLQSVVNP